MMGLGFCIMFGLCLLVVIGFDLCVCFDGCVVVCIVWISDVIGF